EQGDAGELPETAQAPPSGALTAIGGSLGAADADVYAIFISDPSSFSASTIAPPGSCLPGQAAFDTQLFLFDANGKGVVHNDDSSGVVFSAIDNSSFCITQPGVYYLAITSYNRDPIGCDDGFIWNNTPFTGVRCPDGPESSSRVKAWNGAPPAGGSYIIFLTGAQGASPGDPADCPPPAPWDEQFYGGGDAGDLPSTAQLVTLPDQTPCQSPVARIRGEHETDGVDMFVICITDPAAFVASTVDGAGFDTQLWLFNCDGTGVAFNDDSGGLQSRIDGLNNLACAPQAGVYLLAISRYNRDAVDVNGQFIWNNSPFTGVRCPDGPGAANAIAGWTGANAPGGPYTVSLQGAYFVSQNGCNQGPGCRGDANRDGRVDDADLLIVLFQFGQSGFGLQGDLDNNGTVDDADLLIVLFNFGCGS
ncbi:MAG: DVUA0089 family protein, partial [Fimbriimonadales bacterium]|nr:DVUA0089 family protein [Fimbriimonadales bacterium]